MKGKSELAHTFDELGVVDLERSKVWPASAEKIQKNLLIFWATFNALSCLTGQSVRCQLYLLALGFLQCYCLLSQIFQILAYSSKFQTSNLFYKSLNCSNLFYRLWQCYCYILSTINTCIYVVSIIYNRGASVLTRHSELFIQKMQSYYF